MSGVGTGHLQGDAMLEIRSSIDFAGTLRGESPEADRRDYNYWWTYDEARRTFRHRSSGEEIRYGGLIRDSKVHDGWQTHRFDYVYRTLRYPLHVDTQRVPTTDLPRPLRTFRHRSSGEEI